MPKYGNLDLDPKNLILLTQLFCHVEEVINTLPTSSYQYLAITLRQSIVKNVFLTENNRIWFCVFWITFAYLGKKINISIK